MAGGASAICGRGGAAVSLPPCHKLAYSVPEAVEATPWGKTKLYEMMASGEIQWRSRFGRRYIMRSDLVRALPVPIAPEPPAPEPLPPEPTCGVYLLFHGAAAVYVGRSTNLRTRLRSHRRSGRTFDRVEIIPCEAAVAAWLEAELIRALAPAQNVIRFRRRAEVAEREMRRRGL